MQNTGSNLNTIKKNNISLILRQLRTAPLSCIEISRKTGLSKSSVTTITKEMLADGYIRKLGTEITEYGRRPMQLEIVKEYKYALGISLHRKEISACVTDLYFNSLNILSKPITEFSTPEEAVDWAYNACVTIINQNNIESNKILGIGIAAPGPLDYKNGIIINPPNFPLIHNFHITEYLKTKTKLPIFVNNVSTLMALCEKHCRLFETKNYLFAIIDKGVGSAIMINDSIHYGASGFAGEVGHISIDVNGTPCVCGNRGCVENYITKKNIEKKFNLSSYEEMVDSAYQGDKKALEILDYVATCLGCSLLNAINILDLQSVVISGELNYRHELLFSKLQEYINKHCIIYKSHPIKILASSIDPKIISYSCAVVLERYFNQELS